MPVNGRKGSIFVVKGISRRVIVVHPGNSTAFEQAIFIVKDDGDEQHDVLREACSVAESYVRTNLRRRAYRRYTARQLFGAAGGGAGLMGLVWLAVQLIL